MGSLTKVFSRDASWLLRSCDFEELVKDLEEAVETEDFERAKRVSDSLASAERNRARLLVAVREVKIVSSAGPNANSLDLFPQALPDMGANAPVGAPRNLDFLRSSPQVAGSVRQTSV